MTFAAQTNELPDAFDRERAIATFDRNVVVTAGAGTGKTTLLVDRLAHLLLRNPDPLQITDIVALTFTNKAANEMRQRLRERLHSYLEIDRQIAPCNDAKEATQQEVEALLRLYQLSKDELDARLHEALRNLERADIGTIHSFAATLLRLYPLEAGVDPQFQEDEGKQFERIFDEQWKLWLDQELLPNGGHAEDWRRVLKQLTLGQIKELANSLCSETVELARGGEADQREQPAATLRLWLQALLASAAALVDAHPEDRVNEKLVRAARAIIEAYLDTGGLNQNSLADERQFVAEHSIDKSTKGWSESAADEARNLVRVARGLWGVDPVLTELVWRLLVPYVKRFREIFVYEGFVSFDGLLIRARNLVRDHLRVREELKRKYQAILIDEFQDTDPIQYEILLYLAEQLGHSADSWRAVKLVPGKVFVVGDPKQSIYAFRRADIEAYLEVVEKIIKAQGGTECQLTTNFRSDAAILDVVNGIFQSLIQAQRGLQPAYVGIQPAPQQKWLHSRGTRPETLQKVLLRTIVGPDKEINAEQARHLEAESLAAWLSDEVLNQVSIVTTKGESVRAQPKDVAILFRKLTDIHDYLEPLRRRGIRYVVEGERHFYAAKEIIDTVNLLRAIDNPHDRLALVGVLRSPLGALTDQSIYDLHRSNLLDYRRAEHLSGSHAPRALAELYRLLARLHDDCRRLPVAEAVSRIFAALPLKPLAACYYHGEQAVANLEKLRQQAGLLGREDGTMTFRQAIRQLQKRVLDVKEEGESVLAEENVDAVRIMSIHKSKGLEFPIVVLAGCHTGIDSRQRGGAEALFDWSTGLSGISVGPFTDLAGLFIAEKNRRRTEEEQKRIFYVAMTRARDHLVISGAANTKRSSGNFISMLDGPLDHAIGSADESTVLMIGPGSLKLDRVIATLTPPGRGKRKKRSAQQKRDWQPYIDLWTKRRQDYEAALGAPAFVTPTSLKRQAQELTQEVEPAQRQSPERTPAMLIGELTHRLLENWEFAETESQKAFSDRLDLFLADGLPRELQKDAMNIRGELTAIFERFLRSDIYAELTAARILGREVPLLMPWGDSVMEGVIDLIYEHNGLLYLADYKTDRIERKDLHAAPERYRHQAEIYSRAARQSLKREVAAFKLIFLRLGETVEVHNNANKELWLF
jgi:ATP-dependent helicase/nuclease subunit A